MYGFKQIHINIFLFIYGVHVFIFIYLHHAFIHMHINKFICIDTYVHMYVSMSVIF